MTGQSLVLDGGAIALVEYGVKIKSYLISKDIIDER
jgi:hypothetical protein